MSSSNLYSIAISGRSSLKLVIGLVQSNTTAQPFCLCSNLGSSLIFKIGISFGITSSSGIGLVSVSSGLESLLEVVHMPDKHCLYEQFVSFRFTYL